MSPGDAARHWRLGGARMDGPLPASLRRLPTPNDRAGPPCHAALHRSATLPGSAGPAPPAHLAVPPEQVRSCGDLRGPRGPVRWWLGLRVRVSPLYAVSEAPPVQLKPPAAQPWLGCLVRGLRPPPPWLGRRAAASREGACPALVREARQRWLSGAQFASR